MKRSIQHLADSVAALDSDPKKVIPRKNPFHRQIVREVERRKRSRFS